MSQFKILPTTYILSPLTCFSKKRLFEELSNLAAAVTGIKSATFLRALNEREWAGTTVCAKGVGLPHAVIPKLEQSIAVLAILQAEVPYNTVDSDYSGVDVALAFFISPKEKYETVENKLRLVSQELENTDLVNSLRRVWQENDKMMLILSKLDYELSLQIKPDEKPEAEESQSAANALLQFFTDTIINTISGDRDEDGENKQKSAKQQDANAIKASAQVDAQHVSQEDMALAKAIAATNPVFNSDAQAKDGVMGELQNAAAASLAGDGASSHSKDKQDLIGAQQIAHIEKKELNEAKAEALGMGFSNLIAAVPAAPESPSLISSIMQALSDTFNDAVQGEDRQEQEKRKAIERIRAASTYVEAQRKVQDEDQSSAQGVVGVPQDYRPKSKNPAIAGSHDLLEHFRSPSATTNIKSFISDTFGRSLRGKEAQKAQDVFPAEAFIRVDEVPLEPPAPVSQVKPQELVDSSPLSAALNESYVDSYGSQDSTHLPSHEPYPYRVHPVEQQTVSGVAESNAATQTEEEHITLADIIAPPPASASSPATTAATANTNATVANIASVPAETAKVVEVAQSKEGTVVAPDTKQEAASLQSTGNVVLAESSQVTVVSNEASANAASDGTDATVAVTSEDEDGGKRSNMSPEAIRSITNSSMESQDGPRDGFIFGAAPSPEIPVADSTDGESDESDADKSSAVAAVSAILNQLTSAISNVISSDKDSDDEEQAKSATKAEMANVTAESAESSEIEIEDASAAAAPSQQESEEQIQASTDSQIEGQDAEQAQNEAPEMSVDQASVTDELAVETVTGMPHQEESAEASATADEALLTVGGFAVGNQAAKETNATSANTDADSTTDSNTNEESEHGEKKKKDLWDKIVEIVTPQSQKTEKEQGSEGSDQVQDVVGDDESQTAEEQAVSEEEKAKAEAFAKALEIAAIGPRNPNLSVADVLGEESEEHDDDESYHGDQLAALAVAKEAAALTVPKTVVTALSLDEVMAHEPTGVVPVQEQDKPDEPQDKGDCTATDDAKDTKDESSVLLQAPRRDLSNISITAALEAQLRQNHIPKPDPLSQDDVLAAENEARALTPRSINRAVLAVTTARKEEAKDAVEAVKAEAEAFTAPAPEAVVATATATATATTATEQQSSEPIVPEEVTPLKVDSEAEAVSAETVAPQVEPVEPEEDLGLTVEDVLGTAPAPEALVATATSAATTEQHAPEPIVPEEITPLQVPSENEAVSAETAVAQVESVEPEEDLGLTVEDVLGTAPAPEALVATATAAATTDQQSSEPVESEDVTPLKVPLGETEAESVSAETVAPQVEPVEPEEDLGLTVEDVLGAEAAPKVDATIATAVTTEQQASEPVEHEGVTPLKVDSEAEVVSAETDAPQVEPVEQEEDLGLTVEDVLGTAPAPEAVVATAATTEQQGLEPIEPKEVTPLKVPSEAEAVSAETVVPQVESVEQEEDLGLTVEDVLGSAEPESKSKTGATKVKDL